MVMSIVYPRLFANEVRKKEQKDIKLYHFKDIMIKKALAALFIYFDRRLHIILILEYKILSIKSLLYQSPIANNQMFSKYVHYDVSRNHTHSMKENFY